MFKYERILTDDEQKYLEHDLLDIKDWIDKAIIGKINNCMKRLAKAEQERLMQIGVDMIPAKLESLCKSAFNSKDYKNRQERDSIEFNRDVTK